MKIKFGICPCCDIQTDGLFDFYCFQSLTSYSVAMPWYQYDNDSYWDGLTRQCSYMPVIHHPNFDLPITPYNYSSMSVDSMVILGNRRSRVGSVIASHNTNKETVWISSDFGPDLLSDDKTWDNYQNLDSGITYENNKFTIQDNGVYSGGITYSINSSHANHNILDSVNFYIKSDFYKTLLVSMMGVNSSGQETGFYSWFQFQDQPEGIYRWIPSGGGSGTGFFTGYYGYDTWPDIINPVFYNLMNFVSLPEKDTEFGYLNAHDGSFYNPRPINITTGSQTGEFLYTKLMFDYSLNCFWDYYYNNTGQSFASGRFAPVPGIPEDYAIFFTGIRFQIVDDILDITCSNSSGVTLEFYKNLEIKLQETNILYQESPSGSNIYSNYAVYPGYTGNFYVRDKFEKNSLYCIDYTNNSILYKHEYGYFDSIGILGSSGLLINKNGNLLGYYYNELLKDDTYADYYYGGLSDPLRTMNNSDYVYGDSTTRSDRSVSSLGDILCNTFLNTLESTPYYPRGITLFDYYYIGDLDPYDVRVIKQTGYYIPINSYIATVDIYGNKNIIAEDVLIYASSGQPSISYYDSNLGIRKINAPDFSDTTLQTYFTNGEATSSLVSDWNNNYTEIPIIDGIAKYSYPKTMGYVVPRAEAVANFSTGNTGIYSLTQTTKLVAGDFSSTTFDYSFMSTWDVYPNETHSTINVKQSGSNTFGMYSYHLPIKKFTIDNSFVFWEDTFTTNRYPEAIYGPKVYNNKWYPSVTGNNTTGCILYGITPHVKTNLLFYDYHNQSETFGAIFTHDRLYGFNASSLYSISGVARNTISNGTGCKGYLAIGPRSLVTENYTDITRYLKVKIGDTIVVDTLLPTGLEINQGLMYFDDQRLVEPPPVFGLTALMKTESSQLINGAYPAFAWFESLYLNNTIPTGIDLDYTSNFFGDYINKTTGYRLRVVDSNGSDLWSITTSNFANSGTGIEGRLPYLIGFTDPASIPYIMYNSDRYMYIYNFPINFEEYFTSTSNSIFNFFTTSSGYVYDYTSGSYIRRPGMNDNFALIGVDICSGLILNFGITHDGKNIRPMGLGVEQNYNTFYWQNPTGTETGGPTDFGDYNGIVKTQNLKYNFESIYGTQFYYNTISFDSIKNSSLKESPRYTQINLTGKMPSTGHYEIYPKYPFAPKTGYIMIFNSGAL